MDFSEPVPGEELATGALNKGSLSDGSGPCSLALRQDFPEAQMSKGCGSSRGGCRGSPNSLHHSLPPEMGALS